MRACTRELIGTADKRDGLNRQLAIAVEFVLRPTYIFPMRFLALLIAFVFAAFLPLQSAMAARQPAMMMMAAASMHVEHMAHGMHHDMGEMDNTDQASIMAACKAHCAMAATLPEDMAQGSACAVDAPETILVVNGNGVVPAVCGPPPKA
jgi:hypothetical protein